VATSTGLQKVSANSIFKKSRKIVNGFWKPVSVAPSGCPEAFHDSLSGFVNPFKPIGVELENTLGFGKTVIISK
jgi:hypothetical protein